jgi:hypothetical protein
LLLRSDSSDTIVSGVTTLANVRYPNVCFGVAATIG